jgi:hypothetical protein
VILISLSNNPRSRQITAPRGSPRKSPNPNIANSSNPTNSRHAEFNRYTRKQVPTPERMTVRDQSEGGLRSTHLAHASRRRRPHWRRRPCPFCGRLPWMLPLARRPASSVRVCKLRRRGAWGRGRGFVGKWPLNNGHGTGGVEKSGSSRGERGL